MVTKIKKAKITDSRKHVVKNNNIYKALKTKFNNRAWCRGLGVFWNRGAV